MGVFKDISKLNKQAKEIQKNTDVGAQSRNAVEQMKQFNQQMAAQTAAMSAPMDDAVRASAQVLSISAATGMFNMNPIMPVELLVTQEGSPPRPVSTTITIPVGMIPQVQPGRTLTVQMSASNPTAIAVDWSAPIT